MKVVGKIISVNLTRKGITKEGKPFENYQVEFHGDGDKHLVDVFITLGGTMTGQDILNRRGLVRDSIGEMDMQYSIREFDGKTYRDCRYVAFRIPQHPNTQQAGTQEPSQQEVVAGMAEAAAMAEAHINPETGLPF